MEVPTVSDIDAITAIADPIVRNLRITQCYHELSRSVATRVTPGANWCTFATWASKQAGQTIRGEDLARAVDDTLGDSEVHALIERVSRLATRTVHEPTVDALAASVRRSLGLESALRRAATSVAAGNLKVFAEIGREFAHWLSTAAASGPPDTAATDAFCAALRPGDPPDGQRLLRDAFASYCEACAATDADARAERVLLANLLIGLHEQTRLQPDIAAALDATLGDDARQKLLQLLFPGFWLRARAALARLIGRPLPLDVALDALLGTLRRKMRLVLTETVMTLRIAGTAFHLGRDVPGSFPTTLTRLDHPALREMLLRVDPTPDSTAQSGASDWASLSERMHFIADLFRTCHDRTDLFEPPFGTSQVEEMRAGRRPRPPL